ncbi:MAG: flavodoxin family protein [Syntrophorhabdales bacterium]|jgi:multimeric flavodoxin WrbA
MAEKTTGIRTILGIIGSPRRLGNCELFAKEVSRHVDVDHRLDLVRLSDLTIMPCQGCYSCIGEEGRCRIQDDTEFLIEHVRTCDALIIASPVYFLGTHGSVKRLLDRAFSFFHAIDTMEKKPCILVNTYGMRDRIGCAPQALRTLAAFLGVEVKASVSLEAALPGDILLNEAAIKEAARLGRVLFDEAETMQPDPGGRACPFCGNNIVRIRETDLICTLCHGTFTMDGEGGAVPNDAGWDVLDIRFVREHRLWLAGMKARFLATRKELSRLSGPYRDIGRWLKPE